MESKIYSLFNATGTMQELKDTELPNGQILWLNGYGQSLHDHERKAIYDSYDSGGRLMYKTINLDTFRIDTHAAYTLKPNTEIFGIGIYYTPGDIVTKAEVYAALARVEEIFKSDAIKIQAAITARAKLEADTAKKYKHLKQVEDYRTRITATQNIRQELKVFKTKFSVTSERYSGGDSIRVAWTDGPTVEQVEKIVSKYQDGSFNSTEDIYESNHSPFNALFGGAKWVQSNRHYSLELEQYASKQTGIEIDEHGCNADIDKQRILRDFLTAIDMTDGSVIL